MSSPSQQTRPSLVKVLSLLDEYSETHEKGNVALKQSLWNLYKARHFKGGQRGSVLAADGFHASDVREELRARAVLTATAAGLPDLVTSETKKKNQLLPFCLADALELEQAQKENATTTAFASSNKSKNAMGLRNRKTDATGEGDSKKEWSVENEEGFPSEEDRLLSLDPVSLFGGLPPRELLKAQTQAKLALAEYVAAANLVAALQRELNIAAPKSK